MKNDLVSVGVVYSNDLLQCGKIMYNSVLYADQHVHIY